MPLEPPPELVYASLDEAVTGVRVWAREQGYSVRKIRSKTTKGSAKKGSKGTIRKVWIQCAHSGKTDTRHTPPQESRKRKRCSQKMGCPFEVRITRDTKTLTWKVSVVNGQHIHEATPNVAAYSAIRMMDMTPSVRQRIHEMSSSGIKPKEILMALKEENPSSSLMVRDIYNERASMRVDASDGRTRVESLLDILPVDHEAPILQVDTLDGREQVEGLLDRLRAENVPHAIKLDKDHRLSHLFWAPTWSLELLRANHFVFLIDAMYKTNRYNMPLAHIVGMSACGDYFSAAFCFVSGEDKEDYDFILQQFRQSFVDQELPQVIVTDRGLALSKSMKKFFPTTAHLLCRWHVNNHIITKCKTGFGEEDWREFMKDWQQVMLAKSESSMALQWMDFMIKWVGEHAGAINYIAETWLPWKDQFVSAWTDKVMHFEQLFTSGAEELHSTLESLISDSSYDLEEVYRLIDLSVHRQYEAISMNLANESAKTLVTHYSSMLWRFVNRKVSYKGLQIMEDKRLKATEFAKQEEPASRCTGVFRQTMGLPCSHEIYHLMQNNQPIPLHEIHPQWLLKRDLAVQQLRIQSSIEPALNNLESSDQELQPYRPQMMMNKLTQLTLRQLPSQLAVEPISDRLESSCQDLQLYRPQMLENNPTQPVQLLASGLSDNA